MFVYDGFFVGTAGRSRRVILRISAKSDRGISGRFDKGNAENAQRGKRKGRSGAFYYDGKTGRRCTAESGGDVCFAGSSASKRYRIRRL